MKTGWIIAATLLLWAGTATGENPARGPGLPTSNVKVPQAPRLPQSTLPPRRLTGCPDHPACSLECQCGCNYGGKCTCPVVQVRPTGAIRWNDRADPAQPVRGRPVKRSIRGGNC